MKVATNVFSLIGNTPLLQLKKINTNKHVQLFAKLEMFNPTGSIKDRIVLHMIEQAEKQGLINHDTTIIEATSGNTGASLAMIANLRGYKSIITTTEKTSEEKIAIMRALGAQVNVMPARAKEGDDNHYITAAQNLNKNITNSYMLNQYHNQLNTQAHYLTTGPEIWSQMQGEIDYFIACGSSGGTISGIGKYLKEKNPNIKVILSDPIGSIYYDYFQHGKINQNHIKPYKTEGAGKDIICNCIDFSVIDDVIQFSDDNAFSCARELAHKEGILSGGSSGGATHVACNLSKKIKKHSNIVTILPDSGMKYLSKIFLS